MKRLTPLAESELAVLDKLRYFNVVGLWVKKNGLPNPARWLGNFSDDERAHAVNMLNAFLLFSEPMVDALFSSAFQSISATLPELGRARGEAWARFRAGAILTHIDTGAPTDSGYLFARKARQVLGLSDAQIMQPDAALRCSIASPERPLVIVDDLVGTGEQFEAMWRRDRELGGGALNSFALTRTPACGGTYLCSLLITDGARERLQSVAPGVTICAAHELTKMDSLIGSESALWQDELRATADAFVKSASDRAGISPGDRYGFGGLGLALAFAHGVPDSTLPLYYHERDPWAPLVRRT